MTSSKPWERANRAPGNVAGIDVGTNSVRLLIVSPSGAELERHMVITRLGQGVDQTGTLAPEAIARTLAVLERYAGYLMLHDVTRVRATATSAARDASNRDDFFAPARALLGDTIELLSGEDEAKLSFLGATADLPAGPQRVIFDIGGGSTEFALGTTEPEAFVSVNMGSVRLTERFLHSDPPTQRELQDARVLVDELLNQVESRIAAGPAASWVGLAGTVTTFASLQLNLERYDPARTHGSVLLRSDVDRIYERLSRATVRERELMLLEPKRASVIVGGALILKTIMHRFQVEQLQVSEKDILDGLAASIQ